MGKRILIIDDQATIALFLRHRLEELGFEVRTATNGVEGIKILRTESINGILLNLEMPVMNGLAMLNRLRQMATTIPVIAMSADPTRSAMIKAIESGAEDYLFKPISGDILKHKCLRLFS